MHTIEKGDLAVANLTAEFLRKRFIVLKPISELTRYDLVIDRGKGFERVQCKSGRLRNGAIVFATCSSMNHHGGGRRNYRGQIELFGVYCADTDTSYLVPVNDVGLAEGRLRFEAPKNKQSAGVKLASNYQV
jgi:hypothetical protein